MNLGKNDPCFCGSGKKFKNCCMETFGSDFVFFDGTTDPDAEKKFFAHLEDLKGRSKVIEYDLSEELEGCTDLFEVTVEKIEEEEL